MKSRSETNALACQGVISFLQELINGGSKRVGCLRKLSVQDNYPDRVVMDLPHQRQLYQPKGSRSKVNIPSITLLNEDIFVVQAEIFKQEMDRLRRQGVLINCDTTDTKLDTTGNLGI